MIYNIIQGNTYNIPFQLKFDNNNEQTFIDISKIKKVQIIVHDIVKVYPKELQFIENTFYMPLSEQETFNLPIGNIKYQVRVWYTSNKISATYAGEMNVHEVLTYKPISKNAFDDDFTFNQPITVNLTSDIQLPQTIVNNIRFVDNQNLHIDFANGTTKVITLPFGENITDFNFNTATKNLEITWESGAKKLVSFNNLVDETFLQAELEKKQNNLTVDQINHINDIVNKAAAKDLQDEVILREQGDLDNKTYIENAIAVVDKKVNNLGASLAVDSDMVKHIHIIKMLNSSQEVVSEFTLNIPLESTFVAASWNEALHIITFTLQNGAKLEIPIGSMLKGLVTEEMLNERLTEVNKAILNKADKQELELKQNALSQEQIHDINSIKSLSTAIQDLEIDKLDVKIIPIAGKKVSQLDARTLIDNYKQYEGYELHFYTNGDNPTNFVAKGFLVCDENFDPHLILTDGKGVRYEYDSQGFRIVSVSKSDLIDKLNVARYILDSSEIGPDNYITQETAAFIIDAVDRGYDNRFIEFLNGTVETVVFATGYIITGKDGTRRLIVIYSDGKIISYTNIDYNTPFVTEEQMIGIDTKINRTMQLVQQLSQRVVELENKVK